MLAQLPVLLKVNRLINALGSGLLLVTFTLSTNQAGEFGDNLTGACGATCERAACCEKVWTISV